MTRRLSADSGCRPGSGRARWGGCTWRPPRPGGWWPSRSSGQSLPVTRNSSGASGPRWTPPGWSAGSTRHPSSQPGSMTCRRGSPRRSSPAPRLMTLSPGSGRCLSRRCGGWPPGSPRHSAPFTPSAWCTETSSQATCCSPMTGRASSTLASPAPPPKGG